MELYPLKFKTIYKEKLWGGRALRNVLNKRLPKGKKIGESWEISDVPGSITRIANGKYKGKTFNYLIKRFKREFLGDSIFFARIKRFPVLIKFISADDTLSIQVHPPDEYAMLNEDGKRGKVEAWYIIDVEKGAKLVRGVLPGINRKFFSEAVKNGEVEKCLNSFEVNEGDVIFLPPGTVHSIGEGITLLEVQQTSDISYRIHDWGRVNVNGRRRKLHIQKALDVIDFNIMGKNRQKPVHQKGFKYKRELLVKCDKFMLEYMEFRRKIWEQPSTNSFHTLTLILGKAKIRYGEKGKKKLFVKKGETVLMPAYIGEYSLVPQGKCKILRTTI